MARSSRTKPSYVAMPPLPEGPEVKRSFAHMPGEQLIPYQRNGFDLDRNDPPPNLFVVSDHYEWLECDIPPNEGFAVYVKTSITNAEKRQLKERHDRIVNEFSKAWREMPEEQRDFNDSPKNMQRRLIAPMILNWNAVGTNAETGELERLPAPNVAGPDIFDCITDDMYDWLILVLIGGYTVLGKAGNWRSRFDDAGPTSETPTASPTPESDSPPSNDQQN
jgi:hypothetical protein